MTAPAKSLMLLTVAGRVSRHEQFAGNVNKADSDEEQIQESSDSPWVVDRAHVLPLYGSCRRYGERLQEIPSHDENRRFRLQTLQPRSGAEYGPNRLRKRRMLLKNSSLIAMALLSGTRNVYPAVRDRS